MNSKSSQFYQLPSRFNISKYLLINPSHMIPAARVVNLNEISLIPSERGQPQLVIRNKIFQKKTEKRTIEGVVICRNWSCKDLTCKVRATSTHHVGSNSACDIASFSGVELKGDDPHTCHSIGEKNCPHQKKQLTHAT